MFVAVVCHMAALAILSKGVVMKKYFAVLALAVAFVSGNAEAGCRGGLFGGRLRGGNCDTSCGTTTSCGHKILSGRQSCCSSGSCSTGCSKATPAKADAKVTPAPKATAPSTK